MTEVTTGAADAPSELKGALVGFVEELKGFRQDIHRKLEAQENRMSMFERKTAFRGRTPLSTEAAVEAPHRKAFDAYLRNGDESALRGMAPELKSGVTDGDTGFMANPQLSETVQNAITGANSLRALANVVQVEASSYEALVEEQELASGWGGVMGDGENIASSVRRIKIALHELVALPKATQRLLDDAAFDVEAWLAERISDKFSRAEAQAFINGDGVDKPVGLLNRTIADPAGAIGQIGEVKTGADGDFDADDPAGSLIEMVYALPAHYRSNASFIMSSKTAASVRRLKDNDGRFLWTDSLASGQPARLLGHPVMLSEEMPEIAPGSLSILFGDFRAGYTIVERPELRVLRDPYSAKPHVLFYATKRLGGGLVDGRAIKVLKFAA